MVYCYTLIKKVIKNKLLIFFENFCFKGVKTFSWKDMRYKIIKNVNPNHETT